MIRSESMTSASWCAFVKLETKFGSHMWGTDPYFPPRQLSHSRLPAFQTPLCSQPLRILISLSARQMASRRSRLPAAVPLKCFQAPWVCGEECSQLKLLGNNFYYAKSPNKTFLLAAFDSVLLFWKVDVRDALALRRAACSQWDTSRASKLWGP